MLNRLRTPKTTQIILLIILVILVAIGSIFIYSQTPLISQKQENTPEWVEITTPLSLVHVGSNDSFAITDAGQRAARLVYKAIADQDLNAAKEAIKVYDEIIPKENYGGEYTALQWFSQYLLASDAEKKEFLKDKYVASFFEFFANDDFANLKEYIKLKYHIPKFEDQITEKSENRKAFLEDFILFNNPRREEWERTSKVISSLNIQPGEFIADVGSGPGYYTFKFAELVGDKGKVFAIDTVQDHLNYLEKISKKFNINNVKPVLTQGDTIGIGENQVDRVFLCSLYHNIYGMTKEDERSTFVESIKKALKPNGILIVVDNSVVKKGELPYHGPYIAKELIIGQLKYYGFRFVKAESFIPQRYVLTFKKA